jgi:hypothetical protein
MGRSGGQLCCFEDGSGRRRRASHAAAGRPRDRCRGVLRSCAGAVTQHAPAARRRPTPPSSAPSGHGDTGRHGSQAHRLPCRSSPEQRTGSRCRGAGRWAIRWAKPRRIGPYQAQCQALSGAADWAYLQVCRRLGAPRMPCFTRERPVVRNHPRPSRRVAISRHFVGVAVWAQYGRDSVFPPSVLPWAATDGR